MKRFLSSTLLLAMLSGCAGTQDISSLLTPYRIDVRQGNFVTQEMVAQLKLGQTKEQIRFILGTPLVADMFHSDRWDYIYRFQPGHGEAQQRRMAVHFSEGRLARVTGDVTIGATTPVEAPVTAGPSAEPAPATGDAHRDRMKLESSMTAPAAR